MFHLVKDSAETIENNLLWVKSVRDSIFSWWFNVCILVFVVGIFGYFLYSNFMSYKPEEIQNIPFEPRTWNNAVRNVPIYYGEQIDSIENGDSLPGFEYRGSTATF